MKYTYIIIGILVVVFIAIYYFYKRSNKNVDSDDNDDIENTEVEVEDPKNKLTCWYIEEIRQADKNNEHPAKYLPNYGLRVLGDKTEYIKKNIGELSLEDLANYADWVVVSIVESLNKDDADLELAYKYGFFEEIADENIEKLNDASIGGIAYIILNSNNATLVETSKKNYVKIVKQYQ
jgi:hypothetical protein